MFDFTKIKSIGHFFAKAYRAVENDTPKVINALEKAKPTIEGIEMVALGPNAPLAVTVTDLAFAGLGELSQVILALGPANRSKLLDLGFDKAVLAEIEDAIANKFGAIPKLLAAK